MANTDAVLSATVTLDAAGVADTVTFANYAPGFKIRNTHVSEHASLRVDGEDAVYEADGTTFVEAGETVYVRGPKQKTTVISFIGDVNGEPSLVIERVSALPSVFVQDAPADAVVDLDETLTPIADAVVAHELDDGSLALLEASTEAALNALGVKINALIVDTDTKLQAIAINVNAVGTTVNEVIDTLVTTATLSEP